MELLGSLKTVVNKFTFLSLKMFLTSSTWWIASSVAGTSATIITPHRFVRRAYSFNDRPGLRACVQVVVVSDDDHHDYIHDTDDEYYADSSGSSSGATSPYTLRRTASVPPQEDVDIRAEVFINNFYKHLMYEKQVSWNLRYIQHTSSSNSSSSVSPLSSASSFTHLIY